MFKRKTEREKSDSIFSFLPISGKKKRTYQDEPEFLFIRYTPHGYTHRKKEIHGLLSEWESTHICRDTHLKKTIAIEVNDIYNKKATTTNSRLRGILNSELSRPPYYPSLFSIEAWLKWLTSVAKQWQVAQLGEKKERNRTKRGNEMKNIRRVVDNRRKVFMGMEPGEWIHFL